MVRMYSEGQLIHSWYLYHLYYIFLFSYSRLFICTNVTPLQGCIMLSLVEIGPVVLEKIFCISSMYFRYFVFISRWKKAGPLSWTNLNYIHSRIFNCNWPSASGEEKFKISSMHFQFFVIISLWKRMRDFIWTKLNPLHPKMLWFRQCIFAIL